MSLKKQPLHPQKTMLYQPWREKERENEMFTPCCLRLRIASTHLIKEVPMFPVERTISEVKISSQCMQIPLCISCSLLFILKVYRHFFNLNSIN